MLSDRAASPRFPLIERAGRFPRLLAIALGALAACGFRPLALWPLTLLGIALLIELIARRPTARGAFTVGWCFGLGHFTLGNNWIATAFTYQANMPAWLGMIAVVLLALYLAIYPAIGALCAFILIRPERHESTAIRHFALILAFAATWIVSEWLRAWVFTGFAWNPLGAVLLGGYDSRGLALAAPWLGTYGLSGLLVLIAGLPGLLARLAQGSDRTGRLLWALPAIALFAALALVMSVPDLWAKPPAGLDDGAVRFTLVQPDLRQEIIDDPRHYEANFVKLARLSAPRDPGDTRVVFWPESGVGDYLRDGYPSYLYRLYTYAGDPVLARQRIGRVVGPYGVLMTGAVDLVVRHDEEVAARNSVTAIDGRGSILASYSKAHLVPYGEYLALRWLLEPLGATRLVPGQLDFWPGPGPRTVDLGAYGKAGIQICYEIVFSGEVVDPSNRPDYIFNPSNDGWFGAWGPPQHLTQARLRAIEEGLPVLRSTTTGISAVIDAYGLVRAFVPRHQPGRIDGYIPRAHPATPFARYGNALPLAFAALLAALALCVIALGRRRR